MTDERAFNFRKNPSIQHRIRKIVSKNKTGDVYGVTIPKIIVENFIGCWMRIYTSGCQIILESGCKMSIENIDNEKKYCYDGMRIGQNKFGQVVMVK